jgi:hypothetical protein
MRKRVFKEGPKIRYERTLNRFVDALIELGARDPLKPEALRDFLSLAMSIDGTFPCWFKDHGVKVSDPDIFSRLCCCAAGAVVEGYLRHKEHPDTVPTLVLADDVASHMDRLIHLAIEQGKLNEEDGRQAREDIYHNNNAPNLVDVTRTSLEDALTDELVIARDIEGAEIPRDEREREISKAALLRLRIRRLRKLAEDEGIPLVRDAEAIATLVTRKYKASRSDIAKLVLNYEVPNPERGYTTRLMPLNMAPDIDGARVSFDRLKGKAIRLGVAQWLIITEHRCDSTSVSISGEVVTYGIKPQRDYDDFEITAAERRNPVSLRLKRGILWAEVDGPSLFDMRLLREVLRLSTDALPAAKIDLKLPTLTGQAGLWDSVTVRMLHLLEHGLRDTHLDYQSLTQAQFASPRTYEAEPERPAVKSVRLQGQHVLASSEACGHVSKGRTLTAVDMFIRWQPDLRGDGVFTPVRIGLAADHATVLTGFGRNELGIIKPLHTELVTRIRRQLDRGISEASAMDSFVAKIEDRASAGGDPDSVDIFGPSKPENHEIQTGDIRNGASA